MDQRQNSKKESSYFRHFPCLMVNMCALKPDIPW